MRGAGENHDNRPTNVELPHKPGNSILLRFLFSEKPRPDVLGHGHEPIIVDPLAVDRSHIVPCVAHDVIHGHLVAAVTPDGLEGVPEAIEPQAMPPEL